MAFSWGAEKNRWRCCCWYRRYPLSSFSRLRSLLTGLAVAVRTVWMTGRIGVFFRRQVASPLYMDVDALIQELGLAMGEEVAHGDVIGLFESFFANSNAG